MLLGEEEKKEIYIGLLLNFSSLKKCRNKIEKHITKIFSYFQ